MEEKDLNIKLKLEQLYPNNEVIRLYKKDNKLYNNVLYESKRKNLNVKNYIESLGFAYINSWTKEFTETEIVTSLSRLFPNKVIKNISDISINNTLLYRYINKISKEKDIDLIDYLEELGFEHFGSSINSNYDMKAIYMLYTDYNVNMAELARIVGTSKQNLNNKLKSKKVKKRFI